MLIKVWEVYKANSQDCLLFKTQQLAEKQTIFDEVDFIDTAYVNLYGEALHRLNTGQPVLV